jgi:hypothetical protein
MLYIIVYFTHRLREATLFSRVCPRAALFCFFGMLVAPCLADTLSADGEVIIFRNGDRISGRVVRADGTTIRLRSRVVGEVTVSWADVLELRSTNSRVKFEDVRGTERAALNFRNAVFRSTDSTVEIEADSQTVSVPAGTHVEFARLEHPTAGLTQLANVKNPPTPPDSSFSVGLNAPESVVLGSQSQIVLGGSFDLAHNLPSLCAAPSWETALSTVANHNKTYKVATPAIVTDTFDGKVSLANGLSSDSKNAGFVLVDMTGNSSLGIGLQQSYGLGFSGVFYNNLCEGSTPLLPKRHKVVVNGDASIRYIHQRLYAPGTSQDLAGLRLSEGLVYALYSKAGSGKELFSFDESVWAIPMLNEVRAIEAGGLVSLTVPISKLFSIVLTEEDDFFNDAPKARRKNYVKSAVTLTYTFPPPPKN